MFQTESQELIGKLRLNILFSAGSHYIILFYEEQIIFREKKMKAIE